MNSCIVEASADARVDDSRSDQQNPVLASELAAKEGSRRRCHILARARVCSCWISYNVRSGPVVLQYRPASKKRVSKKIRLKLLRN